MAKIIPNAITLVNENTTTLEYCTIVQYIIDMDSKENLKLALSLYLTPEIGASRYRSLLSVFLSPQSVFSSSFKTLKTKTGLRDSIIQNILNKVSHNKANEVITRCDNLQVRVFPYHNSGFPSQLHNIPNPPAFLFVKGGWPIIPPNFAIVGTRSPSSEGEAATRLMTQRLVSDGFTIVSGLALGIDTIAHTTALQNGGKTIAVLGCGPDISYPQKNKSLYNQILKHGTVISEYPPNTRPEVRHFPMRNRIIAGLSCGTLVAESGRKSGALITAQNTIHQKKPLFALPGSVFNQKAEGCNRLINNGARIVTHPSDISNYLRSTMSSSTISGSSFTHLPPIHTNFSSPSESNPSQPISLPLPPPNLAPEEKKLFQYLSLPRKLSEICHFSGSATHSVLTNLLNLELRGLVQRLPGAQYLQT